MIPLEVVREVVRDVALVAAGLGVSYFAVRKAFDDWYPRIMNIRTDQVRLNAMNRRAALATYQHITADENGRLGVVLRANGDIVNLDTRAVFNHLGTQYIDQVAELVGQRVSLMLAAGGSSGNAEVLAPPDMIPELPDYILSSKLLNGPPNYHRLILGQTINKSGRLETVTSDLADLVHIAVGGSSGWGKSWFLRWLAFQLTKSTEAVQLALIDLEGATLAPFAKCDSVLWPLADTEQDAIAVMRELTDELDRRRSLYAEFSDYGIDSLYSYNEIADEPLPPLVCIADEITALLSDKAVESHLRTLSLRGRKYGLWLMLAGQDWKASSLDTAIRNQLSTCVQFKARDATQSRVLLGHPNAADIDTRGRAFAWLPGREMVEMQAPVIEVGAMYGNGPLYPMPEAAKEQETQPITDDVIMETWNGLTKQNKSQLCEALGGQPVGGFFYKIDTTGKRLGLWE